MTTLADRVRAYAAARGLSLRDARIDLLEAGLERRQSQANGARAVNARRTPEERSAAARKAVLARYGRV